jgi:hypothetical protein
VLLLEGFFGKWWAMPWAVTELLFSFMATPLFSLLHFFPSLMGSKGIGIFWLD